jgi:hypothetical protein
MEKARDEGLVRGAVEIAVARAKAEIYASIDVGQQAQPGNEANRREGRALGAITQNALIAAFIVVADTIGTSEFPTVVLGMAKAIARMAEKLGFTEPLDPKSSSVKRVAKLAMEAARKMDARDSKA